MQKIGDITGSENVTVVQAQPGGENQEIGSLRDVEDMDVVQVMGDDAASIVESIMAASATTLSAEEIIALVEGEATGTFVDEDQFDDAVQKTRRLVLPELAHAAIEEAANAVTIASGVISLQAAMDPHALAVSLPLLFLAAGFLTVARYRAVCKRLGD